MSTSPGRSGRVYLAAALGLALVAAALMPDEAPRAPPPRPEPSFPRHPSPDDVARATERRTFAPPPPPSPAPGVAPEVVHGPRDPVLAVLPPKGSGRARIVVEANALFESPAGRLVFDCLTRGEAETLAEVQRTLGVDPTRDLDRVALAGDTLVLSGHFGGLDPTALSTRFGAPVVDGEVSVYADGERKVARYKDELVLVGPAGEVDAALDVLTGRAPGPATDDEVPFGELSGELGKEAIAELLAGADGPLADLAREVADRLDLHLDAHHDVALVAGLAGSDPRKVDELARSLAGALALARAEATRSGEAELAELLDYARIVRDGSGETFRLELAVPLAFLGRIFSDCGPR